MFGHAFFSRPSMNARVVIVYFEGFKSREDGFAQLKQKWGQRSNNTNGVHLASTPQTIR